MRRPLPADGVRSLYTALAPAYDAFARRVSGRARRAAVAGLGAAGGDRVLDAGTGTGLALPRLVRQAAPGVVWALDATPAMLARARRRAAALPRPDGVRFVDGDLRALPFPDGAFDAVFSSYVVDVLPAADARAALRELVRVLRPGGRLALVTMAPPRRPAERLWAALARHVPAALGRSQPVSWPAMRRVLVPAVRPLHHAHLTQAGFPSHIVIARRR
jgi:demethylmenaquinone methyltransferase/2-methoxy-6-polyprenyl-1,4-benzoquinol methylase